MIKWHHQLNGPECEQTLGNGEEQGSLVGCSSWVHRVGRDLATEQQQLLSRGLCMIFFFFLSKHSNSSKS